MTKREEDIEECIELGYQVLESVLINQMLWDKHQVISPSNYREGIITSASIFFTTILP